MARRENPEERARREAEEAYLILSNPQARSQYDRLYQAVNLVKNFDGMDRSKMGQGILVGTLADLPKVDLDIDLEDPEGVLPDDFADIFQAAIKNIINAAAQLKDFSDQEGNLKDSEDIFLDLVISPAEAEKGGYFPLPYQRFIICSQCHDKNRAEVLKCPKCEGAGRVMAHRRVEIKIPKNIPSGEVLKVAGEGHAPGGDLLVKIVVKEE